MTPGRDGDEHDGWDPMSYPIVKWRWWRIAIVRTERGLEIWINRPLPWS